jgi:hypothetical protein
MTQWAHHYKEIPEAIRNNSALQSQIAGLIPGRPIHGKRTEGGNREQAARDIMIDFFDCQIDYSEAYQRVLRELPEHESRHAGDRQTFSSDWNQALVRMQAVRFYNHGAFLHMKDLEYSKCYIPHSPHEYRDSECTVKLAGSTWEIDPLLDRLVERYDNENYNTPVTIPSRPNCTHTPVPPDEVED